MLQEQIIPYIRENPITTAIAAGLVVLFFLLLIFAQVTRTRYEVYKICKKIRKYFDVILSDGEPEGEPAQEVKTEGEIPVYQTADDWQKQQELEKKAADAKLLMDVISEVF